MKRMMSATALVWMLGFGLVGGAMAGSLNPTNAPGPTMRTLEDIYRVLASQSAETKIGLNNTNTPAATMHSLDQIYALAVAAMSSECPVGTVKTGQTISYGAGDDGDLERGVAWPNPIFTVGTGSSSNCVTDNRTGLMWLRNPPNSAVTWSNALSYCMNLDGADGRGGYTDWRMPNVREAQTLLDYAGPAGTAGLMPVGHPFVGTVLGEYVWTGNTLPWVTDRAWIVSISEGIVTIPLKSTTYYAWPVRGGN